MVLLSRRLGVVAGVVLALIGALVDRPAASIVHAQPAPHFTEAALNLADPRPCIPEPGLLTCDPTRLALWNGEAGAWAARGVTDPDARFNETVNFRVRAADPAAIAGIARILGWPYLAITRVRFGDGSGREFVEITNLGGGSQSLLGLTIRSSESGPLFRFPLTSFVPLELLPGERCLVPSAPPTMFCTGGQFLPPADFLLDDAGWVVLFDPTLDLLIDQRRYSADPNNQPPPPNLQGVRTGPMEPPPAAALTFTLLTDKPAYTTGEPVVFRMVLRNDGSTPETLQFPSTQRFDVVVRSGQVEVWRWSDGRAFGEALGTLTLQPGEEQTFTATWEQPTDPGLQAPPGPYQATAKLTTTTPITSPPVTFSIR